MFERGLNKRGQEGVTLTTLLLIVLGVIVVVVIVLGATGILGDIFDIGSKRPGQNLEVVVQSCGIAADAKLVADYCYTFKELEDDAFVSCDYGSVKELLVQQGKQAEFTCDSTSVSFGNAVKNLCLDQRESKRNSVNINGQSCTQRGYGPDYQETETWTFECVKANDPNIKGDVSADVEVGCNEQDARNMAMQNFRGGDSRVGSNDVVTCTVKTRPAGC